MSATRPPAATRPRPAVDECPTTKPTATPPVDLDAYDARVSTLFVMLSGILKATRPSIILTKAQRQAREELERGAIGETQG